MTMPAKKEEKLIHIARIKGDKKTPLYLFLRQKKDDLYQWTEERENGIEIDTKAFGSTIEDAIAKARKLFKQHSFRTVNCGFLYTLPERDEHGMNALFHQMKASYLSANGIYFDEKLKNNFHVQFASDEAKDLMYRLNRE